ncbi:MAG: phenylalanine--tRNA ligase subunit beta, partial [Clostridia bacterium]|nr:phenylalanine--tRNA ligase subunit beta [Clostridia bacterium]
DISFIVASDVKWEDINRAVSEKKPELLRDLRFVDEYRGKQIPAGKKSVTVRLIIGSSEKTLAGPEIEAVAKSVMKRLSKTVEAEVRM